VDPEPDLSAGDFSAWLGRIREALLTEGWDGRRLQRVRRLLQLVVLHAHQGPDETRALALIRDELLVAAPGLPEGHVVLGYDDDGRCPMLGDGLCSIYEHRPLTCRGYDCRVFAARGIAAGGGDRAKITQRARRWRFDYPTRRDRREHAAVQATAQFIQGHAECFPGGAVPRDPSQSAILAIKAYGVFLEEDGAPPEGDPVSSGTRSAPADVEVAEAVVKAYREFDAQRSEGPSRQL